MQIHISVNNFLSNFQKINTAYYLVLPRYYAMSNTPYHLHWSGGHRSKEPWLAVLSHGYTRSLDSLSTVRL